MKEKTFGHKAFELLAAANALANITDQPISGKGMISVNFEYVSQLIHAVQRSAHQTASLLIFFEDEFREYNRHKPKEMVDAYMEMIRGLVEPE